MQTTAENAESQTRKIDSNGSANAGQQAPDVARDFDLESLRLPQSFREAGVKRLLTRVPLRRPTKFEFVRVHPEHFFETTVIDLKDERETYVVDQRLSQEVLDLAMHVRFLLAITRQRVLLLWPIRLPGD